MSGPMDISPPETRPAKRARDDEAQTPISRSSEFWLEDGTVIIQASDIQFRVHRGTLSMHSEFFEALFEVPPPQEPAIIEGCPVVEVTDASKDWVALLKMLYRPFDIFQQDSVSPLFYASVVRLGKKYEFTAIAQAALNELKKKFRDPRTCITQRNFITVLSVIEVVEELRIDILRPALYYWGLRYLLPIQISDGVLCTTMGVETLRQLPGTYRSVLIAYRDAVRHSLISQLWLPHYKTRTSTPCHRGACYQNLLSHITAILTSPVDLHVLERSSVDGLCPTCQAHVSACIEESLSKFFTLLPDCFSMEKYDNLKDYAE